MAPARRRVACRLHCPSLAVPTFYQTKDKKMMLSKQVVVGVFSMAFLGGAACDLSSDETGSERLADVMPYAGQLLMEATVIRSDSEDRCPETQRVALFSRDGRLHVLTRSVAHPTCGIDPQTIDARSYSVVRVDYQRGTKVYTASSPLGVIWIRDQRLANPDGVPWGVDMFDYESPLLPPAAPPRRFRSLEVKDQNLLASGKTTHEFQVYLEEPVPADEFSVLCHSLMLEPGGAGVVGEEGDLSYSVRVVSDLEPEHIASQLSAITGVRAVRVR